MTNIEKGPGPTASIRPDCERATTWRDVFGSETVPVKTTKPRRSILPSLGEKLVFDVDVARLDEEQIRRAAETIHVRFGVPRDQAEAGIRGEHGIPLLADDIQYVTEARSSGNSTFLHLPADHYDGCACVPQCKGGA